VNKVTIYNPNDRIRRIEAGLQIISRTAKQRRAVEPAPPLDLPRTCAWDGRSLWIARYISVDGQYEYRQSIAIGDRQRAIYAPEDVIELPPTFRHGMEQCAHCFAWTLDRMVGSVWCPDHKGYVCFGNTSRSGFFTCHCGKTGQLKEQNNPAVALIPSWGRS
jgi:hypothetical protein